MENGRIVSIALVNDVKKGDYVLTNADLAIKKISAKEASEINEYFSDNRKQKTDNRSD